MESTSFLESWKTYTIRDKILFGSFILPFFISIIHLLIYFPLFGIWFYDGFLGELLFWEGKIFDPEDCVNYSWETGSGINTDCRTTFVYVISPIWLLLSVISIGIYGFFLFKTSEETSKLLNREGEDKSGPSALARINTFMTITAGAQILIFLSLLVPIGGLYVESVSSLFKGIVATYQEYCMESGCSVNPLSYLYFPHLIATVALAYYSRNKNKEENIEFIEQSEEKEKDEKEAKEAAILRDKIDRAKYHERLLEFYEAEEIYKELKMDDELIRIRKLKTEQGAVKVAQKIVHGDEVTKTEIKDSVVSKSSIGSGGDDKLTKIKELKELHDAGAIDDDEFKQMKKEILGK